MSAERKFFSVPALLKEGSTEEDYWELFSDLLMVAAASAVADAFKENTTIQGFGEFLVFYLAITNGWLLYTHHYRSRFAESSLFHSMILFFFLVGMAGSIVNVGFDTAQNFFFSIIVQRCTFFLMILRIFRKIPEATAFGVTLLTIVGITVVLSIIGCIAPITAPYVLTIAVIIDTAIEFIFVLALPRSNFIPIDMDHTRDRMGVLVLVTLGETVISATIAYRELADEEGTTPGNRYYIELTLSFLLIFMFTLVYFNAQPDPRQHAFERNRILGAFFVLLHRFLGLTLLLLSVSVKIMSKLVLEEDSGDSKNDTIEKIEEDNSEGGEANTQASSEEENTAQVAAKLICASVGCSLMLLFLMRLCHYGGRVPAPTDSKDIKMLVLAWWTFFAIASVFPVFLISVTEPLISLGVFSGLLLILCVVDNWFTNTLAGYLAKAATSSDPEDRVVPEAGPETDRNAGPKTDRNADPDSLRKLTDEM